MAACFGKYSLELGFGLNPKIWPLQQQNNICKKRFKRDFEKVFQQRLKPPLTLLNCVSALVIPRWKGPFENLF